MEIISRRAFNGDLRENILEDKKNYNIDEYFLWLEFDDDVNHLKNNKE